MDSISCSRTKNCYASQSISSHLLESPRNYFVTKDTIRIPKIGRKATLQQKERKKGWCWTPPQDASQRQNTDACQQVSFSV